MTFEDFVDTVRNNIRDYLPEKFHEAEISISPFQKLNGSYLGMQVRREGQVAVPTVNLERAFSSYSSGRFSSRISLPAMPRSAAPLTNMPLRSARYSNSRVLIPRALKAASYHRLCRS